LMISGRDAKKFCTPECRKAEWAYEHNTPYYKEHRSMARHTTSRKAPHGRRNPIKPHPPKNNSSESKVGEAGLIDFLNRRQRPTFATDRCQKNEVPQKKPAKSE